MRIRKPENGGVFSKEISPGTYKGRDFTMYISLLGEPLFKFADTNFFVHIEVEDLLELATRAADAELARESNEAV